ncbi:MAG: DUF1292 domain-containing protein [Eubacterium sp.]|nr:DUF1292 domain-containing protein [Eubacterium sp.]
MGQDFLEEGDDLFVTLMLEDDTEVETQVITIFTVEDEETHEEQDYIVLIPVEQVETEEGEVYIYRYLEDAEGNPDLENIETEEEFELVSKVFDEILEDGEYDEDIEVATSEYTS